MARIRTVKPEFFTHYELYTLEKETGFPIRIAFEGLWCQADREGRFVWIPEQLKLGCLPYDDVDFSRVLHALSTRDFIVKYTVDGRDFGCIPGFLEHQVINNRESASRLPEPTEESISCTRESRDDDASTTREVHAQGEGKGKEGKGKERKGREKDTSSEQAQDELSLEDEWQREVDVLDFLNQVAETKFQSFNASGKPTKSLQHIRVALKIMTPREARRVAILKCEQWKGKPEMETNLNPTTLYGRVDNRERYLAEVQKRWPAEAQEAATS